MPDVFRFKRFDVDQEGCAMKINTDGVLLGATATINRPARILDIGTGTGVIALMLAQRYPSARITAIEIDPEAANTADKNFKASPFSANLNCQAVGLQHFETRQQFDLIVSNPPYFLHSLTSKDDRKRLARHTEVSFFDTLLMKAISWLSPAGSLQLVLPTSLADYVAEEAFARYGMTRQWEITIHSFESDHAVRKILALGPQQGTGAKHRLVIYASQGQYSAAYRCLLADFFIKF